MTALTDMAAVRPPGIGDARVPCPLCGGLIHPVAGRCKHCKEDLTSFRAGRPQAAAALPRLDGHAAPSNGHDGNHRQAAAAPIPIAVPAREASQPILPPRPTGRSLPAQRAPRGSMLRNWPLLVIILAVIAIVIAAVIMVLPQERDRGRKLMNPPAPAPERMETNPVPPKSSAIDPWSIPDDPDIAPVQPVPAPVDPFDPDVLDNFADPDIYGGLLGSGAMGLGGSTLMFAMFERACKKLKTCPGLDHGMISSVCDQFAALPVPTPPRNCPAAQRCLDAIDNLSCTQASGTNPLAAVYLITECTTAMRDC